MDLLTPEADFLQSWRETLHRRADEAIEVLSAIPTVKGLLLAGGVGRGAEWPLSDIDVIGIYSDSAFEQSQEQVHRARINLMSAWEAEGFSTSLDIKGIVFTEREIESAVDTTGEGIIPLLADRRFYHGMDKAHGGEARYDTSGLAGAFLSWVNRERYSPAVVDARLAERRRQRNEALTQAQELLAGRHDTWGLSQAVDLAIVTNTWLLMEIWGDRGSVRRGPTFAERRAASEGEHDVVETLLRLRRFDIESCQTQFASAPEHVHHYAQFAWEARRRVSEEVTEGQNTRDAVVLEASRAIREETRPHEAWVGVDCHLGSVVSRLESLREVVAGHHLLRA